MQESVEWDPSTVIREPSLSLKVYVFFLLVMVAATIAKLIRVWIGAGPFRLSKKAGDPAYLRVLQQSSRNLAQWVVCAFLGWGIVSTDAVYNLCRGMLSEKASGMVVILFVVEDLASSLGMTLSVVLLAYLVRWHIVTRISRLQS